MCILGICTFRIIIFRRSIVMDHDDIHVKQPESQTTRDRISRVRYRFAGLCGQTSVSKIYKTHLPFSLLPEKLRLNKITAKVYSIIRKRTAADVQFAFHFGLCKFWIEIASNEITKIVFIARIIIPIGKLLQIKLAEGQNETLLMDHFD